jgi:nucleotide-binding universal stress UspA family protein
MKTILVPTDFSETANSAATYAAQLAKSYGLKIILLHVYHLPLPSTGADFGLLPDLDLEKENFEILTNYKNTLLQTIGGGLDIECQVRIGFAVDEIESAADDLKADLLVMGISGGGKISEFLMGSTATTLLTRVKIPALVIPPKTVYRNPDRMVFACDYKKAVSQKAIQNLKNFMALFHAKLSVLNFENPDDGVTFEKAVNGILLESALSTETHTLHFLPDVTDIADEINDFVDSHDGAMLVMIPHHHNLLHRIFKGSTTKHLAFHTHVPILALQE